MNRLLKQAKSITIVAGGRVEESLIKTTPQTTIIGVDRGALRVIRSKVIPDIAIGDFDSVSEKERNEIQKVSRHMIEFEQDKDATDLELAIDLAVAMRPKKVRLLGVLGGRMDHTIVAVHLLEKLLSHNIYGEIVDNFNKINIVRHLEKFSRSNEYKYFSVLPLTEYATISLKGFKYDVVKKVFAKKSSLGISNEIRLSIATLHVHLGTVLVVRSRDAVTARN
jgi:thiamine pyrophosphokinase